jgi:hypothetical protein
MTESVPWGSCAVIGRRDEWVSLTLTTWVASSPKLTPGAPARGQVPGVVGDPSYSALLIGSI